MGRGTGAVIILFLLCIASVSAYTNEQRLAVLAANMQQLGDDAYALDCGPAKANDNVLNAIGSIEGPSYCVLKNDDAVIFGTFKDAPFAGGDPGVFAEDILASYSIFAPHIKPADLPEDLAIACGMPANSDGFWPCEDIDTDYNTLHLYAYHDGEDTIYLLGSETDLDFGEPTLWDGVKDFFKSLFGMDVSAPVFVAAPPAFDEFHHAFFSREGDRSIAATWKGRTATIVYQGFVTNFSIIPHKNYSLGTDERQRLDISMTAPQDTPQWRRLTSGLRTADVAGEPIGAVCGNSVIDGFDEECERGVAIPETACKSKGYIGGTASCDLRTCTFDVSACTCLDFDNDGFTNDTRCAQPSYDCDDKLNATYPGAKEWCGDKIDNDCDGKTDADDTCTEPPLPPPPCDKDDVCDDDEDASCIDCSSMASSCPSNWTLVHTRANYDFYTRVGLQNNQELLIKTRSATQCWLGSESAKRSSLYIPASGKLLVYSNEGAQSMSIYSTAGEDGWTITGDGTESGSQAGQDCWACTDDECTTLDLQIPKSAATCDPDVACAAKGSRLFSAEDCCNCLIPGGDVCIDDPMGCYGTTPDLGRDGREKDNPGDIIPT